MSEWKQKLIYRKRLLYLKENPTNINQTEEVEGLGLEVDQLNEAIQVGATNLYIH